MDKTHLSYASVHWEEQPFTKDYSPYLSELVDVALMELAFRDKANEYADKGNFDFADRVVKTGSVIVDYGIRAINGEPGSEEREKGIRAITSTSQALEESLDRCRVPSSHWKDVFADSEDDTNIPQELLDLYNEVWAIFAEPRDLSHVKFGYTKHH